MHSSATADVFQAIADPTRRSILESLRRAEQPVSRLAAEFPVTLSAVSQHMRVLREAGLVSVRRRGASACIASTLPRCGPSSIGWASTKNSGRANSTP